MKKPTLSINSGFSLLEVLLAVALVAIALPAIGHLISIGAKENVSSDKNTQALGLAHALMEEIASRRFQESALAPGNGIDSGEENVWDRSAFDDIDDYDIFAESWGSLSPPRSEDGTSLTEYSDFSQWVSVENIQNISSGPTFRDNFTAVGDGESDFKLVTVKILWNDSKDSVSLFRVIAK